jgi:succinate dehydrogenase flavin-adding protein (antitoxin of CptAB toxin-antitoxin module)
MKDNMKTKKDYNYKQYTFLLDLNDEEERGLAAWLDNNKKKNNGYGAQIRKALKKAMKEENQQ